MNGTKIIAFYLPQFHSIPENDEWWGEGFTEWTNVKKAVPLFKNQYQPRIPANNNYYNLLDVETIKWQAQLARDYGIFGFCMYHYWFDGHMLLEKPVELFLKNKDININFCICWANEDWTNAWATSDSKTLISQKYGGKSSWKEHYDYLKPFFEDSRYIKEDGKPLVIIYRPEIIPCLNEMIDYWQILAKEDGFKGLKLAYQHVNFGMMKNKDDSRFDYQIEYQPAYARTEINNKNSTFLLKVKNKIDVFMQKRLHKSLDLSFLRNSKGPYIESYDEIWQKILNRKPDNNKAIPGAFVDWDNTPRRGSTGLVINGASPEVFGYYFRKQLVRTQTVYKKDMLFIFAWNEWAEGGYLEPDSKFGCEYLKEIKAALNEIE